MKDHKDNPGLHKLYVRWAKHHLHDITEFLEKLSDYSNGNLMDIGAAVWKEREKLVKNDAAYQEAAWRLYIGEELEPYIEEPQPKHKREVK